MTTKNRKTQIMPMNDLAYEVLEQARAARISDYVFPSSTGAYFHSLDNTWKRIRAKAGLQDIRMHDVRHTFATNVVAHGESLYHLQSLLGHKTGQMTQRYAHLRDEKLRKAANSFNTIFADYKTWSFRDILALPEEERNAILQLAMDEGIAEPGYGEEPTGIDDQG
ncbi:site-specific integrase, partial [Desulfocurvus sp.]|uniref:tyrosine-type recombinase/integrase n=1 Tax=Desulfocurvus sp. TaxID=2871698 RepID=UPI0025BF5344